MLLNIGWSAQGGLSLGISGGVGFEGGLYVGISINYGFKTGNFSANLNAGALGGYITGGYDTQAGWMVGAGYAAPSAFSGWSPVSFSTNMLSAGIDYSENGGFSANGAGFSYGSGGLSFNPSIGASYTGQWGLNISESEDNLGVTTKDKSIIKTNEEMLEYFQCAGIDPANYSAPNVDIENQLPTALREKGYVRANGIVYKKENGIWAEIGGVTASYLNGFSKATSNIYMSTYDSFKNFTISIRHEFIHSSDWASFGHSMSKSDWNAYKEFSAYTDTHAYHPSIGIPNYNGPLLPYNKPNLPFVPSFY